MTLEVADARAALHLVDALIRERAVAGRPVAEKVRQFYRRLDATVSSAGQHGEALGEESESWIGTRLAAEILGRGERWTRRHAADLDGQLVGRSLMYPERAVREYAEALQDKESHQ